MIMFALICCPHTLFSSSVQNFSLALQSGKRLELQCVEATAQRLAAQLESANRRAGQDRTEIPWAIAGACAWTGVEDPDTMQGCTLLNELEPGDRAPDISERLADLQ